MERLEKTENEMENTCCRKSLQYLPQDPKQRLCFTEDDEETRSKNTLQRLHYKTESGRQCKGGNIPLLSLLRAQKHKSLFKKDVTKKELFQTLPRVYKSSYRSSNPDCGTARKKSKINRTHVL